MIWIAIIMLLGVAIVHITSELSHYRQGHDVYDWTTRLGKFLDKRNWYGITW